MEVSVAILCLNNRQYLSLFKHERHQENTDGPGDKIQCYYMPFGKNLISDFFRAFEGFFMTDFRGNNKYCPLKEIIESIRQKGLKHSWRLRIRQKSNIKEQIKTVCVWSYHYQNDSCFSPCLLVYLRK